MFGTPRSWPHLVGRSGQEAAQIIRAETGLSNIQIIGPGMAVTMDYRTDRTLESLIDKAVDGRLDMNFESRSWPQLVGKDGNEAVETIKKESGFTNVSIVKPGTPMTMDYRTNRVRVMVDDQGKVLSPPTTG